MRTVTSWLMMVMLSVVLLVTGLLLSACAAFQKAVPYMPPPQDIACVADEVEIGHTDPVLIMNKCNLTMLLVEDVIKLIQGATMAKAHRLASLHTPDAGPPFDAGADAGR